MHKIWKCRKLWLETSVKLLIWIILFLLLPFGFLDLFHLNWVEWTQSCDFESILNNSCCSSMLNSTAPGYWEILLSGSICPIHICSVPLFHLIHHSNIEGLPQLCCISWKSYQCNLKKKERINISVLLGLLKVNELAEIPTD